MASPSPLTHPRRPADLRSFSKLAAASFVLALAAAAWSFVGVFWGPGWVGELPPTTESNERWVVGGLVLIAPAILGLVSLYLGSHSMDVIERNRANLKGDGLGVFAVMLGMLAFVAGAVGSFATLFWPLLG